MTTSVKGGEALSHITCSSQMVHSQHRLALTPAPLASDGQTATGAGFAPSQVAGVFPGRQGAAVSNGSAQVGRRAAAAQIQPPSTLRGSDSPVGGVVFLQVPANEKNVTSASNRSSMWLKQWPHARLLLSPRTLRHPWVLAGSSSCSRLH
ncbi:ras-related protein Rap-1b [Platysternon megacephalum]|uniref:Ras-related protein Rap-1b n=1 Tax=Platysternon megacephalum TaxID=55544 RepID=A0A4D9EE97_9SAUR|nr:ras-related protein Rap-1b [Platysternon megacephalum]